MFKFSTFHIRVRFNLLYKIMILNNLYYIDFRLKFCLEIIIGCIISHKYEIAIGYMIHQNFINSYTIFSNEQIVIHN